MCTCVEVGVRNFAKKKLMSPDLFNRSCDNNVMACFLRSCNLQILNCWVFFAILSDWSKHSAPPTLRSISFDKKHISEAPAIVSVDRRTYLVELKLEGEKHPCYMILPFLNSIFPNVANEHVA